MTILTFTREDRKLGSSSSRCSTICKHPNPKNIKQYRKCVKRRQLNKCLIGKAKTINVCAKCKNKKTLRSKIKCFKNDCDPNPNQGGA